MELLDRYLQAVRFWLPKAEQDDIIAELSANIREQMEDKAAELGRPLDQDEQAAILKQHGRPILVASQYSRGRKQLIGPGLFPIYRFVVKLSLAAALGIYFVVAVIMALTGGASLWGQLLNCPSILLTTFAWITLVFAALEMGSSQFRFSDRWDPLSLPRVTRRSSAPPGAHISRWQSLSEVVFGTAFGAWWLSALRSPHLLFGPGAAVIAFGPVWHTLFVPILMFMTIDIATAGVNLVRPDWVRFHSVSRLVSRSLGLAIAYVLFRAGGMIVAAGAGAPGNVVEVMNNIFRVSVIVGALVLVGQIAMELRATIRRAHRNTAAAAS